MKKLLMLLAVVLFPAFAFALNAQAPDGNSCKEDKEAFEQHVNAQSNTSFIMQYIIINLADDPVRFHKYTEEEFTPLARCYETYSVKGTPLVDFVRANADIFRPEASDPASNLPVYDELKQEALNFANLVERLSQQAALNEVAAHDNDDWVVQHILGNLADPMAKLTDEQAKPKAAVYKQLKVRKQPLTEYVRSQAERFESFASNVSDDLNAFANRVAQLAK